MPEPADFRPDFNSDTGIVGKTDDGVKLGIGCEGTFVGCTGGCSIVGKGVGIGVGILVGVITGYGVGVNATVG